MKLSTFVVAAVLLATRPSVETRPGTFQVPSGAPGQVPGVPARDARPTKTGTARIRGHVFAADTGLPLRKVLVRAFSPELRDSRVTTTDPQGAYELKELPAGRYSLNASKGSYVSLSYGQVRPFESGKPLEVLDGQTIEKVDFNLPRGAVISGRILDEFGEPTADTQVQAMRYQYIQGQRRLIPSGRGATTNDLGEYRLFGLPPGQYYVTATLRGGYMGGFGESDDRSGYTPTYYPGTGSVSEGQRLTLAVGQTLNDISMTLVPARTARITGTALDSEGRPLAGGYVSAMLRSGGFGGMGYGANGGQIRPDGSFSIGGLSPGEYIVQANNGNPGGGTAEFASTVVAISGEDVDGVRLVTAKMSTATGRIILDGQAPSLRPSMLRLMTTPVRADDVMMWGGGGATVKDDFTFELKTRPGLAAIRLVGMSPDCSLRAVRVNGQDVTDSGIEFRPNEDIGGIEVELTTKVSQISGLVTNSRGDAVKDYTVVVFARDQEKWKEAPSRYFGIGRPDQDGRFKIRALPSGEYYAIAVEYIELGEVSDPEFLDRMKAKAIALSLGDGESRVLDLKLSSYAPG